ncbi:MAG: oligosaccharide flippase family protein, partial [Thermoprotei archaeon]
MRRQAKAARGAGNLFVGNTLSVIVQGVGAIVVARLLGVRLYGLYTLALVPAGVVFVFTRMGIAAGTTRYIAHYRSTNESGKDKEILAAALTLGLFVYLGLTGVSYAVAPFFASEVLKQPGLASLARFASVTVVLQGFSNLSSSALNGYFRTRVSGALLVAQAVAKYGVAIGLIAAGLGIYGAVAGTVAGFGFGAALGLLALWRHGHIARPRRFRENAVRLLSFGLGNYVSSLTAGLSAQLQLILIADLAAASAVGAFTAAGNMTNMVGLVSYPVATILVPAFAEVSSQGSERLASSYSKAAALSALTIIPASAFLAAVSGVAFPTLYGHSYRGYEPVLVAAALGGFSAVFAYKVQGAAFTGTGNTWFNAYSTGTQS